MILNGFCQAKWLTDFPWFLAYVPYWPSFCWSPRSSMGHGFRWVRPPRVDIPRHRPRNARGPWRWSTPDFGPGSRFGEGMICQCFEVIPVIPCYSVYKPVIKHTEHKNRIKWKYVKVTHDQGTIIEGFSYTFLRFWGAWTSKTFSRSVSDPKSTQFGEWLMVDSSQIHSY